MHGIGGNSISQLGGGYSIQTVKNVFSCLILMALSYQSMVTLKLSLLSPRRNSELIVLNLLVHEAYKSK